METVRAFFVEFFSWFAGSMVIMSFLEHQIHRGLMHRKNFFSKRLPSFEKIFREHAVLHHGLYYKAFDHEPDDYGRDLNLHLSVKKGFLRTLPLSLCISLVSIPGAIAFLLVVYLHHLTWNLVHEEMHKPSKSFFANWPLYKFLARHHYLHHKYPGKNFNVVLPFADYVLNTHAQATDADYRTMSELGILGRKLSPAEAATADETQPLSTASELPNPVELANARLI